MIGTQYCHEKRPFPKWTILKLRFFFILKTIRAKSQRSGNICRINNQQFKFRIYKESILISQTIKNIGEKT